MDLLLVVVILIVVVVLAILLTRTREKLNITGHSQGTYTMSGGSTGPIEYEEQFAVYDKDPIVARLKKLGATHVGTFLMSIIVYNNDTPVEEGHRKPYIRIRREQPNLSTFTVKTGPIGESPVEREIEITPDQAAVLEDMMKDMGHTIMYRVEKIRDLWHLPEKWDIKEVVFDETPGLPLYMEVDGHTQEAVDATVKALKLKKSDLITNIDAYSFFYGVPSPAGGRKLPPGASLTFDSGATAQFAQYLDEELSAKFDAILSEQIPRAKKLRIMHT